MRVLTSGAFGVRESPPVPRHRARQHSFAPSQSNKLRCRNDGARQIVHVTDSSARDTKQVRQQIIGISDMKLSDWISSRSDRPVAWERQVSIGHSSLSATQSDQNDCTRELRVPAKASGEGLLIGKTMSAPSGLPLTERERSNPTPRRRKSEERYLCRRRSRRT